MNFKEIKTKFLYSDIVEKIIIINIIIYIIYLILPLNSFILNFMIPSYWNNFLHSIWSIFTYSFIHINFAHLLSDSLFLWIISRIFLKIFNQKTFIKFYIIGNIGVAIIYLLFMFILKKPYYYLYGSLPITTSFFFALLSYYINFSFFISSIKDILFKNISLVFFGINFFSLLIDFNTKNYISHIGGAIIGFFYMKLFELGKDPFDDIWNFFK